MTDPIVINSHWFADMVGDRMGRARELLSEDIRRSAEARGWDGDLFDVPGRLAHEIDSYGVGF